MIKHLFKYPILHFFAIPIYLLPSIVSTSLAPATYLFSLILVPLLHLSNRRNAVLMHMLFILLMGDARIDSLQYFKTLRIISISLMFLLTVYDLALRKYRFNYKTLYVLPFILASCIPLLSTPVFAAAFTRTLSYLFLVILAMNYGRIVLIQNNGVFVKDILHFAFWVYVLGLLFIPTGVHWVYETSQGTGRFSGLFGNPNGLGLFSTVIFPIAVYYFSRSKHFSPAKRTAFFLVLFTSLILSGSRTALGSVLIFTGLLVLFNLPIFIRLASYLIILPLLIFLLASGLIIDILEIFAQTFGLEEFLRVQSLADASGRLGSWKFGWKYVKDRIWFGGGFTYELYVYQQFIPPQLQGIRQFARSWNTYITLILNNGIIGSFFFMQFIFRLYRKTRKANYKIAAAYFLVISISSFFESWITSSLICYTLYFYLFTLILQEKSLQKFA